MTRRDWIEKIRIFKETSERYHAVSHDQENPDDPLVIEYISLLSELVANRSLFSAEDQAFIKSENLANRLRQFKVISLKYETFL